MAKLIVSAPNTPQVTHDLVDEVITLGRTSANNITINHPSVSSRHAKLTRIPGGYRLTDLDSTNKTWINGKSIKEADLTSSSPVRFGAIECIFKGDAAGAGKTDQGTAQLADLQKQLAEITKARDEALKTQKEQADELAKLRPQLEGVVKEREALQK
ncbi:MAG: FHA domain-containing protein, partial [Verrucomicrobiota bacterium]